MSVKLLYGLPAMLKTAENGSNIPAFVFDKNLRFKFETFERMTIPEALMWVAGGGTLEEKDIVITTVFSSNEGLVQGIKTLLDIKFIDKRTQVEIYEFAETDDAEVTTYKEVDLEQVRIDADFMNVFLSKYVVVRDSTLTKLKSYAGKELKSKTWNIAGEMLDDYDDTIVIKREKPKAFTQFIDIIHEVCPHLTEEEYEQVFKACVKLETKHYIGEDSWRDYCFYSAKMSEVERTLDKLGYLRPYLRKSRLNALLEVISN